MKCPGKLSLPEMPTWQLWSCGESPAGPSALASLQVHLLQKPFLLASASIHARVYFRRRATERKFLLIFRHHRLTLRGSTTKLEMEAWRWKWKVWVMTIRHANGK